MTDPETVRIKARDVKPYHYALWASIMGGAPFANEIVHIAWSNDGKRLWFGLETHNFYNCDPDDELDLVPVEPHATMREKYKDYRLPPAWDKCGK